MKKAIFIIINLLILSACSSMQKEKEEDVFIKDEVFPVKNIEDNEVEENKKSLLTSEGTDIIDFTENEEAFEAINQNNIIHFAFDSYSINNDMHKIITIHSEILTSNKNIGVVLEGHTDSVGDKSYNMILGEKRAEAVKESLTNLGVEERQIKVVSYGEEKPIKTNTNDEESAMAENRRVEFKYQ